MDALCSSSRKATERTYFIDVKEAKNKSKYLAIVESRAAHEGDKKWTRSTKPLQ